VECSHVRPVEITDIDFFGSVILVLVDFNCKYLAFLDFRLCLYKLGRGQAERSWSEN
jgi:hypothetical protein